jgi:hypothetical protein
VTPALGARPAPVVILEGADSSGKTTLARRLKEQLPNAVYLHGRVFRDAWLSHAAMARLAARFAFAGRSVIVDRHWISHLVYQGEVFGGQTYDADARTFDRWWRRLGALYVLCVPADQKGQAWRWERERAAGRSEAFTRIKEVIAAYADLAHGNLARPGDGYLGQLIRYQDFAARDDVCLYDFERTPLSSIRRIVASAKLTSLKAEPWGGSGLTGRGPILLRFTKHHRLFPQEVGNPFDAAMQSLAMRDERFALATDNIVPSETRKIIFMPADEDEMMRRLALFTKD